MCTAVTYGAGEHYFGRNLDLEISYGEQIVVTPRQYPFRFRRSPPMQAHAAMIGVAAVMDGVPLYFDATNEHGLSMAGLNFPGNAAYLSEKTDKDNVAPFELIPWVLGQCENLMQARKLLQRINLAQIPFSDRLTLSPLHWLLADRSGALTVEPMQDGVRVYENPVGVLANNPPFAYHLANLNNYMRLSAQEPRNTFSQALPLQAYSRGMGALGLPGDFSSASRFVRAAFIKENSVSGETEQARVGQFFHILASVAMPRGCVALEDGAYEITRYSSCCNTARGVYYVTTYENSRIIGVDLHREDLDSDELICYALPQSEGIPILNQTITS